MGPVVCLYFGLKLMKSVDLVYHDSVDTLETNLATFDGGHNSSPSRVYSEDFNMSLY